MAKRLKFDESGDSDDLQALFDSISGSPAPRRLCSLDWKWFPLPEAVATTTICRPFSIPCPVNIPLAKATPYLRMRRKPTAATTFSTGSA